MNTTSRHFAAVLSTAAALSLGLASAAFAQQGMGSATNSELDASWVDGSAVSQDRDIAYERAYSQEIRGLGFPLNEGAVFTGAASRARGASTATITENESWVDPSRRDAR